MSQELTDAKTQTPANYLRQWAEYIDRVVGDDLAAETMRSIADGLVRPLRWSAEKPTVPGWYWWRNKTPNGGYITDMLEVGEQLTVYNDQTHKSHSVDEFQGEWAGPIPEPGEERT